MKHSLDKRRESPPSLRELMSISRWQLRSLAAGRLRRPLDAAERGSGRGGADDDDDDCWRWCWRFVFSRSGASIRSSFLQSHFWFVQRPSALDFDAAGTSERERASAISDSCITPTGSEERTDSPPVGCSAAARRRLGGSGTF
jgi:hypothetical protein